MLFFVDSSCGCCFYVANYFAESDIWTNCEVALGSLFDIFFNKWELHAQCTSVNYFHSIFDNLSFLGNIKNNFFLKFTILNLFFECHHLCLQFVLNQKFWVPFQKWYVFFIIRKIWKWNIIKYEKIPRKAIWKPFQNFNECYIFVMIYIYAFYCCFLYVYVYIFF